MSCLPQVDVNSDGSGSVFCYGILDTGYRFDLTDEEALELARRAIFTAAHRDGGSGCRINVVHVTRAGWKWVSSDAWLDLQQGVYKEIAALPPSP